ncbi:MAG: SDR family oxidoreductase [Sediminibacterium sp.]|nr:SDR family oxidoreductase [Sediminibacterium sp.]
MLVVITGASQGIGYAVAEAFAAAGHSLCICSKTASRLKEATESLQKTYPTVTIHSMQADLSKQSDCDAFGNWCLSLGTPSILINNAGFFLPGNLMEEAQGVLETQIAANLYSAYYTSRAIVPAMIKAGNGHIFNICSIASLHAYPQGGSYSISKYALDGFSKNLREELKDKGIKVTGVYPGATYTNSWAGSGVAPARIMEAQDIAKMIYAATQLSPQAVVEDIVMRPQLGDL